MTNKVRAKVYKAITGRWRWYCCHRAHPAANGYPTWAAAFTAALCHTTVHRWRDGPHSRACGIGVHTHGRACHPNCVTCHGKSLSEALSGHRD